MSDLEKRLTKRRDSGMAVHKDNMDGKLENMLQVRDMASRLADYEDKISTGVLVELPAPFISKMDREPYLWCVYHSHIETSASCDKDMFETYEEAEARLKELRGKA